MRDGDSTQSRTPEIRQGVVPARVAQRLPMYYRFLHGLMEKGVERISSAELGEHIGVTASQLRQDLSHFGSFGHQGYGYRVDDLHEAIVIILGLKQRHKLVLTGAGNLGRALANYQGFRRRGFCIEAIFDIDESIIGSEVGGLQVMHVSRLEDYLQRYHTDIGILSVPAAAAQEVADVFVSNGVEALWNFAPGRIKVPSSVLLEHLHLSDSLMSLAFQLHRSRGTHLQQA